MIRYPNIYNMMFHEPISRKVQRSWNIASEVAHTMRRSMRINLQNVKENRKKSAFSNLQRRTFSSTYQNSSKYGKRSKYYIHISTSFNNWMKSSPLRGWRSRYLAIFLYILKIDSHTSSHSVCNFWCDIPRTLHFSADRFTGHQIIHVWVPDLDH